MAITSMHSGSVWRIAPTGITPVFFERFVTDGTALVSS